MAARRNAQIRKQEGQKLIIKITTEACRGSTREVAVLEHVQVVLSVSHNLRGEGADRFSGGVGSKFSSSVR